MRGGRCTRTRATPPQMPASRLYLNKGFFLPRCRVRGARHCRRILFQETLAPALLQSGGADRPRPAHSRRRGYEYESIPAAQYDAAGTIDHMLLLDRSDGRRGQTPVPIGGVTLEGDDAYGYGVRGHDYPCQGNVRCTKCSYARLLAAQQPPAVRFWLALLGDVGRGTTSLGIQSRPVVPVSNTRRHDERRQGRRQCRLDNYCAVAEAGQWHQPRCAHLSDQHVNIRYMSYRSVAHAVASRQSSPMTRSANGQYSSFCPRLDHVKQGPLSQPLTLTGSGDGNHDISVSRRSPGKSGQA